MWTHSGIFIEVRDGKKYVFAGDPKEFEMFAKDGYGELDEEWREDLAPLKEDGLYQVIIGYGGFWEGTNPHGNKKIYCAYKMNGVLDWQPHDGDLLGGGLYQCLDCSEMFRSDDGVNHRCKKCREGKDGKQGLPEESRVD